MHDLTIDDFWRIYGVHPRARVSHLIPGEARGDAAAIPLCGRRLTDGRGWRGTERHEYRTAQARSTCRECLKIAERLIAEVPTQRTSKEDFMEPEWCERCGRDRICEGEFAWSTELNGWQHKWRFCSEDRRYERASLHIPAIAVTDERFDDRTNP